MSASADESKWLCGFKWETGIERKVGHVCKLKKGHTEKHKCGGTYCAASKELDGAAVEDEPSNGVIDDESSPSDTHIADPNGTRAFGVLEAYCGARQQTVVGKTKGARFAPTPAAATCPRCRKLGGV